MNKAKIYKIEFNLSGIAFTYVTPNGKREFILDGTHKPIKPGFSGWKVGA